MFELNLDHSQVERPHCWTCMIYLPQLSGGMLSVLPRAI
jgi:hypothetical protein